MASVSVNGINLYYTEAGSGDPLVLVHGLGFNADVWDRVMPLLAQNNRVIAYDRRGYQRSQGALPPAATYGPQQGDDLIGLLQAINATPATVLGWSAGGLHALYATVKCPELVSRLILYEPPIYAMRNLDFSGVMMFIKLNLLKALGNRQQAANTFLRWVLAYQDGRNSYDTLTPDFRAKLTQDTNTMLAEFGGGTADDLTPELLQAHIKMPVTLLLGEQTVPSGIKSVNMLGQILNAPIVVLPNANHLAHVDQPAEFAAAVKRILAQS
jgi:pimeloyl-ACP methyl ester carboxylesterase